MSLSAGSAQHIFLTGPPGIGKTTIIKKICSQLQSQHIPVKGFYTTELREGGKRVGFDIVSLTGEKSTLARTGAAGAGPRVGQYVVDLQSFESVALPAIQPSSNKGIIVIDEIGKMELFSKSFATATRNAFSTGIIILGTIPIQKGKPIPLVEFVRTHPSVKLITVDVRNRDQIAAEVVDSLSTQYKTMGDK